ncbi:MAG: glycoside hydrolase family 88 protein [Subdoligranulum sp.]|jgi:unsaturated rhamnogalacturonyl hydrolase|nr:glycoside hydrolase family 88 protein [Faecalibacterium sp.]
METTLFYARAACDTMMRKFAAADLPPKGHFYYHQGVFLSGVLKTWQLTGEQKYLDYAASWVHAVLNSTPFVRQYDILFNKWGVLLCQKEYQTNDIRRNSREWL